MPNPLPPEALYRRCPQKHLTFHTTAELPDLDEIIGQDRAVAAVRFGVGMRHEGYNLYVLGPPGYGKQAFIQTFLAPRAMAAPPPADWCYVHNFKIPHKPKVLRLPTAKGIELRRDMERLITELRTALPVTFESDEYHTRIQEIEDAFNERQGQAIKEVQEQAEREDIALLHTQEGFAFAPTRRGEVLSPEVFAKFPEQEQERVATIIRELHEQLKKALHEIPRWMRETQMRVKEIQREFTLSVTGNLIDEIKKNYTNLPAVHAYLDEIQQDVVENVDEWKKSAESHDCIHCHSHPEVEGRDFRRYYVNVLVHHDLNAGAPVVYEDNPTYQALVGRIEHISQMGALVTDFTLIKPGSLHQANGGYLLLDARKLLTQPFAWEGLKRALKSHEIRIESLGQWLSLVSTVSLEPEPIPLNVKVVLIGERILYYLLHAYDPEFSELFKVAVDFENEFPRTDENELLYARLIATLVRREGLRPFTADACAVVIERAARLVEDSERLTLHVQEINNLLCEANWWAEDARREVVNAIDVNHAVAAQVERYGRIRDKLLEEVLRGTLYIDSSGERVGQINALSVIQLGAFAFGHPSRITATVHAGEGHVVDIEREVELGGPIHTKGVLILSAFLAARYAHRKPFSLAANLVFEQSYGEIEGDSASLAELCALLSALADAPIRQSFAITGSVNQHGEVQPIGGVNEKIEGFFDLCVARKLTGEQGVLIPSTNVKHLMLRADVVEAVTTKRFQIYAVGSVDEALTLLTGIPAGERNVTGIYPANSLNRRVENRLIRFTETRVPRGNPPPLPPRRPFPRHESDR